jgi:subtilisin family serine protease
MPQDSRSSAAPRRLMKVAGLILSLCVPVASVVADSTASDDRSLGRRIIVAIAEKPDPMMASGSSPHGYAGLPAYTGSERTRADSARLARDYELTEISAWMIEALQIRCMLYEIPASADRENVLADLRKDRRVRLAQALQEFTTRTATPAGPSMATNTVGADFNDPYVGLQTGFSSIGAGQAQRWSSGRNVSVALIDTGVDATHPDLAGRVAEQRDFVGSGKGDPGRDRHGTQVAGVIAAVANNGLGIVGVAPSVQVLSYRACWPAEIGSSAARCNSFTLAQALGAAINANARVINLSLGGPHDDLLAQLLEHALHKGTIIVGAVPPDSEGTGFPTDTRGVIAVSAGADRPSSAQHPSLAAPGRDILTLEPGGSYDYASGSSLASAHVTGVIALLLQISPKLGEAELFAALDHSSQRAGGLIDACVAVNLAAGSDAASCATGEAAAQGSRREH